MKRLIKGIVILLCATFLMSHNVMAADVDFSGEAVSHEITLDSFCLRWNTTTNYTCGRVHTNGFNEISTIDFYPSIAYQLSVGAYYMEVYYNLGATNSVPNNSIWYGGPNYAIYNASSSRMQFLSSEQVSSTTSDLTYRSYRSIFKYAGGTLLGPSNTIRMGNSGGMFATESIRITSVVFWKVNNSGASNQDIINSINSQSQTLSNINQGIGGISNKLDDTNDKIDDLNDTIQDRQQEEDDALDNIANQDPSDLEGDTDNQQSTNLIGVFSSFVSALSNITAANNCNITLAFPSFAGGSQTVNVCQNKDKGGNLVAIFSSLTLIVFYIPLALKLLSMIYNEIRSFTNG